MAHMVKLLVDLGYEKNTPLVARKQYSLVSDTQYGQVKSGVVEIIFDFRKKRECRVSVFDVDVGEYLKEQDIFDVLARCDELQGFLEELKKKEIVLVAE